MWIPENTAEASRSPEKTSDKAQGECGPSCVNYRQVPRYTLMGVYAIIKKKNPKIWKATHLDATVITSVGW